jgi:hypothetical protein
MLSLETIAVTLVDADAYALSRGRAWTGTNDDKTAALRRGQDYIAGRYNDRWAEDWTDAPLEVEYAIFEAAVRELAAPGSLSPDFTASQRVLSETVGPLSVTYANTGGVAASQPVVPLIEWLLKAHIRPRSMFLERA